MMTVTGNHLKYFHLMFDETLPLMQVLFLIIPAVLTVLICRLVHLLKQKRQEFQVQGMPNMFSKEMVNLFTIMAIFDASFIIRLLTNFIIMIYGTL